MGYGACVCVCRGRAHTFSVLTAWCGLYSVSEVIMWNMYERHVTPAVFAASFCADLRLPASLADRVAEIIMRAVRCSPCWESYDAGLTRFVCSVGFATAGWV